ncbi:transcription elongation factor GreA [bacterium]|nr:MAG: transcription elongation factor GreA [bacterium]
MRGFYPFLPFQPEHSFRETEDRIAGRNRWNGERTRDVYERTIGSCAIMAPREKAKEAKDMNEFESMDSSGAIYLTPNGYDALKAELETLTLEKRPEIAERIRDSQQHGEFSEDNNELDEVKLEQAIVEDRIAELKGVMGNCLILQIEMIPTDQVGLGSRVRVNDLDYNDEFDIQLVSSIEADPINDLVSSDSPLGTALMGHGAGEEVLFEAPDGKKRYRILTIAR